MAVSRRIARCLVACTAVLLLAAIPTAVVASPIGELIKLTAKLAAKSGVRSAQPLSMVARQVARDPKLRAVALSNVKDRHLAAKLTEKWATISGSRYQLIVTRELQLLKSVEQAGIAKSAEAANAGETADSVHKLFRELVDSVPLTAFRSQATLENALRQELARRATVEVAQPAPKFTFELASGKLVFPTLGRVGPVEIKGGDINAYKLAAVVAGTIVCGKEKCVEKVRSVLQDERAKEADPTPVQTEERLRRQHLRELDQDTQLANLVAALDAEVRSHTKR